MLEELAGRHGARISRVAARPEGEPPIDVSLLHAGAAEPGAPLVFCLHGFPDNALSFRHQWPALVDAGYTVICPMLPGYEPGSLGPKGLPYRSRYTLERVAYRLQAVIDAALAGLGREDQPVHLVGHDWGALAGYALTRLRPQFFRSFTAISIPQALSLGRAALKAPDYVRYAWYIEFFQLPWLPEKRLPAGHWRFIDELLAGWSPGWTMPGDIRESIKATLGQPGVLAAALGYYRAIPSLSASGRRSRQLVSRGPALPLLEVQGRRDGCIPQSLWNATVESVRPDGRRIALEAGHFPHQEQPEAFNRELIAFLAEQAEPHRRSSASAG